jgi:hypothetical protein
MKLRTTMGLFLVAIALAVAANGQTQTTSTCQNRQDARVRVFNIERQVPVNGILTTLTVSPQLLSLFNDLLSGAKQIREKMVYDRKANVINGTVFVVDTSTPFPTPVDALSSAIIVQTAHLQIAHILLACQPFQSVMFVGTVTNSAPNPGGYGVSLTGSTVAISTGFTLATSTTPLQLFNTTVSLAGIAAAWAPSATGELRIFVPPGRE